LYRLIVGFVGALGLASALVLTVPEAARAEIASDKEATEEKVVGDPNAKVTVIEYASLGCPHCANFHFDVYPKIKKEYVDTGKVKFIFRDFPLGTPSVAAAMIARCAGSKRYFAMIDIFFKAQHQWSHAPNPLEALKKTARFGGMSSADVDACIANQALLNSIQERAQAAQLDYEINSTPSFVIEGRKIAGGLPYADFKKVLDEALAAAN